MQLLQQPWYPANAQICLCWSYYLLVPALTAVAADSQSHSEDVIPHDLAAVLLLPVSEHTARQSLPLRVQAF